MSCGTPPHTGRSRGGNPALLLIFLSATPRSSSPAPNSCCLMWTVPVLVQVSAPITNLDVWLLLSYKRGEAFVLLLRNIDFLISSRRNPLKPSDSSNMDPKNYQAQANENYTSFVVWSVSSNCFLLNDASFKQISPKIQPNKYQVITMNTPKMDHKD